MASCLEGEALTAACAWLWVKGLPDARESADEMIDAYYPGGLHFFVAEHLIEPGGGEGNNRLV